MPNSYLLEHGSSNDGDDPVAICIRATGNTPMEAVQVMKDRAAELNDTVIVEVVDDYFYRLVFVHPDSKTGDYITVYVNLNNLGLQHVSEDDTEEAG